MSGEGIKKILGAYEILFLDLGVGYLALLILLHCI